MIIDSAIIEVRSGKGGDGSALFRREACVPKGGPDGGDGGRGGDVILLADPEVETLLDFSGRHHWKAQEGVKGGAKGMYGQDGENLVIRVPVGTQVFDEPVAGELPAEPTPEGDPDAFLDQLFLSGAERAAIHAPAQDSKPAGALLVDLAAAGQTWIAAPGGKGGRGNKHFATPTHQAPREAEAGGPAVTRRLRLELKLVADVGLLGKPNAGKSSFLGRVSKASPKIADYPFTTIRPQLGIVEIPLGRKPKAGERTPRLVVADMPGLIENAHLGAGMGIRFLRHVERTSVLLHLIEPEPSDATTPLKNYKAIRTALAGHSRELADKPEILALSKSDLMTEKAAAALAAKLEKSSGKPVFVFSSATGAGIPELLREVWRVAGVSRRRASQAPAPAAGGSWQGRKPAR